VYRGSSAITMDGKGRITIPTRYRDLLQEECGGQVVCTKDVSQDCLLMYPVNEWEQIEKKLKNLSDTNPAERRFKRVLLSHVMEGEVDKNGRLLISNTLRKVIGLEKQIMLVGSLNKFEIWDEAVWQAQIDADLAAIAAEDFEQTDKLQDFSL